MKEYYSKYYKDFTLEQLQAEYEKLVRLGEQNKKAYEENIAKSGKTPEETRDLNREERELVSDGVHLEKQAKIVAELIEEAKAKLQMQ